MKRVIYALFVFAPALVLAQSTSLTIVPFLDNVNKFVLDPLILLLFALSFAYFAYGVVKFLQLDAADKSRVEARNAILVGALRNSRYVFSFRYYTIFNFAKFRSFIFRYQIFWCTAVSESQSVTVRKNT